MTVAVVAGALANKAGNGGAAWTRLSWALGLQGLGFDVHFVERLAPGVPPSTRGWFEAVTGAFGLGDRSTLLDADCRTLVGLAPSDLEDLAADAAVLFNLSGHLDGPLRDRISHRVFVDLDPGFTQIWHELGIGHLAPHDDWLTVGTAVGTPSSAVPTNGLPWHPVLQPVVLDHWPSSTRPGLGRLTTIASWRGFGTLEHRGLTLGPKAHEYRRFAAVPRRTPHEFEMALDIRPDDEQDRSLLEDNGWRLVDPATTTGSPEAFRDYVQGSDAEFSVAQSAYVQTRSGWFSDRTARYLATGRPAIVQETGVRGLPVGDGLLTFATEAEASAALDTVASDYPRHARSARQLAETWLAPDRVLGDVCERIGVAP